MVTLVNPYLQNHSESIYNFCSGWIYPPPLYVSRYNPQIRNEYALSKTGSWSTMGLASNGFDSPECYLRKYSGLCYKFQSSLLHNSELYSYPCPCLLCLRQREKERFHTFFPTSQIIDDDPDPGAGGDCRHYSEPNPAEEEPCCNPGQVYIIDRGEKDCIRENALAITRFPPRQLPNPLPKIVDDHKGHKMNLLPRPTNHPHFAQIPPYLTKRKIELWAQAYHSKLNIQAQQDQKLRLLTDEERNGILKGLKTEWSTTFREFNSLPLPTKTTSQKLCKMRAVIENKLKELDSDIKLVGQAGPLYVGDIQGNERIGDYFKKNTNKKTCCNLRNRKC